MNKLVTIFFFILTVNSVKAQYTGGNNDGYSDQTLTQSACPDLTPNFVYYGGNNDGYSDGTLTQSTCPDLTPNFSYYGGINDGHGDGNLTQSTCPDLTTNFAYYGGNNDGYSDGTLTQSTCPDLTPNFSYYGGINDGYGDGTLTQSICPDPTPNFTYYGGINDGYGDGNLTQSICPDLTPNFTYYGGINDGFGWQNTQPIICTTPLPIELMEFVGICGGNSIKLNWSTATETNNDYFTIERSSDGVNFNILGTVAGAGNSNQTQNYSFTDQTLYNEISYYRLKQTDFNGQFEYTKIITVSCGDAKLKDVKIYPNPATDEVTMEITGNMESVNFEIINSTGEVIYKGNFNEKMTLQTSSFAAGIYVIKFANDYISECKKLIKQ